MILVYNIRTIRRLKDLSLILNERKSSKISILQADMAVGD